MLSNLQTKWVLPQWRLTVNEKGKSKGKPKGKSKGKDGPKSKGKTKSDKGKGESTATANDQCLHCGKYGHFKRDCWKLNVLTPRM